VLADVNVGAILIGVLPYGQISSATTQATATMLMPRRISIPRIWRIKRRRYLPCKVGGNFGSF